MEPSNVKPLHRVFTASLQGHRDANEDQLDVIVKMPNNVSAAVYDGHGGAFVSEYLKKTFLKQFSKITRDSEVQHLIDDTQNLLDQKFKNDSKLKFLVFGIFQMLKK